MIFVHDTRDKPGKHQNVDGYLTDHGHSIVRSKLYVGDITLLHDQSVCIDLKQNVMELTMDVYQQHKRFRDELIRAQEAGILLYVLVEEELPEGRLDNWVSPKWQTFGRNHHAGDPMSKADPKRLRKALITMQERYGVKFRFCAKENAGAEVVRLLTEGKSGQAAQKLKEVEHQ